MENIQLQSTNTIYTSTNFNQNYITTVELYNSKSSTSNRQTQINNKLDVDIHSTTQTINITGNGALFMFQSNKLPELSYNMMSLDVENKSGDNYTTNTVLIQRLNTNNIWIKNELFVNNGLITITATELSFLDGVSNNLQNQLSTKLEFESYPATKPINLSSVSLFNIKSYKDAMASYVDLLNVDVIDSYGYGTNTTIIENVASIKDLIIMENIQLQSTSNIYISTNLNQNHITG